MRRFAWALFGVVALAAGALAAYFVFQQDQSGPRRQVAELVFQDAEGRALKLSDFRDKIVLLNLWATWCVPCREEMPALDRLQRKLGGPSFEVIALSIDSGGVPAVKKFYEEIGIRSLGIYLDPALRATSTLGAVGIPTTLLIDRQGREINRHSGPAQWDGPEAVRMIEAHLKP
jgi:thiol-disulfide isomerase/thioredoxin